LSKTSREPRPVQPPFPHPGGARPPKIPAELVPRHVALVMDGDGRWAKQRGLPRTEGHKEGESSLLDVRTRSPPRTGAAAPTRCGS